MTETVFVLFIAGLALLISYSKWKAVHGLLFIGSLSYLLLDVFVSESPMIPALSRVSVYATAVMSFLIGIYSLGYMGREKEALSKNYYAYYLWTVASAIVCLVTDELLVFLVAWGISGLMLYMLNNLAADGAASAKKSFIMIGASDASLLLGIALLWKLTGTTNMHMIQVDLCNASPIGYWALAFLVIAAFTKAGVFPFHTWVPEFAASSVLPAVAFMPVVMDKILGIFLLAKILTAMFILTKTLSVILMYVGAATIIFAVMMALVQHNYRRLLAYHSVSQVGYMVLGIATLNPVGIFGGLFHLFNNVIYKTALYLSAGNAEFRKNTSEMADLGGLSKIMPVSFLAFLLSSLAISGVPPFNGFASKWMIYRSIIDLEGGLSKWLVLTAAMVGSSLTLASFLKVLNALYFSGPSSSNEQVKEVNWPMSMPPILLSVSCLAIGITSRIFIPLDLKGMWLPGTTTLLLAVAIFSGFIIFLSQKIKIRRCDVFAGGEEISGKISGVDFYKTISDWNFFGKIYNMAEKKFFDVYEIISKLVLKSGSFLAAVHTGILHTYLAWCLLAGAVLLVMYMR